MSNAKLLRAGPAVLLAVLLGACGGGGGSSSTVAAPTPPPPVPVIPAPTSCITQVVADSTVESGKTGGASVLACGSGIMGEVSWTQVSGPAVTLLSSRSPTVSFDTLEPGLIKLRADVRLEGGVTESPTVEMTVAPRTPGSFVTVRSDHSVRPGTDTSVRAWPTLAAGETVARISWTQVSGPTVQMNTLDERVLMLRAPLVASDTALKFRATMTTSLGRQDADDVVIAIERQSLATDALLDMSARVHPYRNAARYAGVLRQCTYDVSLYYTDSVRNNFCKASTLPLLQEEVGPGVVPSVAQVMGRVLVSHDFLGANFEQFLLNQDPHGDFRRMLAGTTAIVLGSHVRPSFYMSATGAIYLDANNLWLTAAERDVVTEVPDYRLAFDDELNYSAFGRQVKNNDYVRRALPSNERVTRSVDELVSVLGRLLYHELAHAADFFTPAQRALDPSLSIWGNVSGRISAQTLVSDALSTRYRLTSVEMAGLGQVLFQGAQASEQQKAYTAADIGRFFGADGANDDYAYASTREDLAMLFEEFMMYHRHGIRYDIAFTNAYREGTGTPVLVAWGQRGRIGEATLKPRVKLLLAQVAPWIDLAAVDTLPAPLMMRAGQSWDANLVLGNGSALSGMSASRIVSEQEVAQRLRDDLHRPRH